MNDSPTGDNSMRQGKRGRMMLKNRHVNPKDSMLGPFRLEVSLIDPQESLGAKVSNGTCSEWRPRASEEGHAWRQGIR